MALSSLSHIRSIRSTCRFATHAIPRGRQPLHPRPYSDGAPQRSAHAQWYADIVPAMIPVALLGSAVYLGLQLTQVHLSNEKYLEEATAKIRRLENELEALRSERDGRTQTTMPRAVDQKSRWWFTQS